MDYPDVNIHSSIIEECRQGNRKAQFRLYNLYSRAMYNVACRILNSREDAEDILQETFTECFRNIGTFRYESTFGAWLKRILVNRCINHLRKRKAELVYRDELPQVPDEVEDYEVPDTGRIIKAIETLPDGYRVILSLYLLEGYDHTEIAHILNISESTSKSQYSRAKQKLRNILSKN